MDGRYLMLTFTLTRMSEISLARDQTSHRRGVKYLEVVPRAVPSVFEILVEPQGENGRCDWLKSGVVPLVLT
ncbi:hypothetical protein NA78x_003963 [Anatilimnocola sp. NA78]|uniref:hypothetical protein n=1 Tax=Anatilimnocola sp. NA78 TaxID=3415683 RepID=UPI003CE46823